MDGKGREGKKKMGGGCEEDAEMRAQEMEEEEEEAEWSVGGVCVSRMG
jgi:hypothetical protein